MNGIRRCACAVGIVALVTATSHVRPLDAGTPLLLLPSTVGWQEAGVGDRDLEVTERFLGVLEQRPRRGTAFDRVYGIHVERGTLDELVDRYRGRVEEDPNDAAAWMIIGLVESKRGHDAQAIAAFTRAEKANSEDALSSYYLAQALLLLGQNDEAVAALERAIERRPQRNDMLEVFKTLGRLHQRAQRNTEAIEVWRRLEELFPDDLRVQEEIADTLADEDDHEQALKRYEALVKKTPDDEYRQVRFRMEAAELKIRLARKADAIADYEALLDRLRPASWLFDDVRRRIEDVFLREFDLAGLADYYKTWLDKHTEDIDAMGRLGRALAMQGRTTEAQEVFGQALKLAPSNTALRLALIDYLIRDARFADAIAQYEELNEADPNNPDYVRRWGEAILKDTSRSESKRVEDATAVWERLIDAKPDDAIVITQVADMFRQARITEKAIEWYTRAVELSPEEPQYREFLGEYYHALKRSDEALSVWKQIADGERRTADNLNRLAEILSGFGYLNDSIEALGASLELDDEQFERRLAYGDLLAKAERFDEALAQVTAAGVLAESPDEHDAVLEREIDIHVASGRLEDRIGELETSLAGSQPTADAYRRLALYYEAARRLDEAQATIGRALEMDNESIALWTVAARIFSGAGLLGDAAEASRKLARLDRQFRSEHLTEVAQLELRLGRLDEALEAGRELLAAAPGNLEHYQFHAGLCFQLGREDEGLDTLRRAVRIAPGDIEPLTALASALSNAFRNDEAMELYWQAFDKSESLDARLSVVSPLVDLHLRVDRYDQLLERLERMRQEPDARREGTICLAQAHRDAGDLGAARRELEQLLSAESRDTQLLGELARLSESEGDFEGAANFQRRLVELSPSPEARSLLARYYVAAGNEDESELIWLQLAERKDEPDRVVQALDSLLAQGNPELALTITERLLREQPKNWEYLYRDGVALLGTDREDEAAERFRAILALDLQSDEKGAVIKAREKSRPGRIARASRRQVYTLRMPEVQTRMQIASQLRNVIGGGGSNQFGLGGMSPYSVWSNPGATGRLSGSVQYNTYGFITGGGWGPQDYGAARIGALAWLYQQAVEAGDKKDEEFVATLHDAQAADDAPQSAIWDYFYLQAFRQEQRSLYEVARRLAGRTGAEGDWLYLTYLPQRMAGQQGVFVRARGGQTVDSTPPLPDEEIDLVLESYDQLRRERPDWVNGQIVMSVVAELKRAERGEDEERIYRQAIDAAEDFQQVLNIFQVVAGRGNVDDAIGLLVKLEELGNKPATGRFSGAQLNQYVSYSVGQLMDARAKEEAHDEILRLLDVALDIGLRQSRKTLVSTKRLPARTAGRQNQIYYRVFSGGRQSNIRIDYPLPNDYFDQGTIQLLRTAYDMFQRDDVLSDLIRHIERRGEQSPEADSLYSDLALSYMHWWNEERFEAAEFLKRAVESSGDSVPLRLELATMHELLEEPEAALEMIDSIEVTDRRVLGDRELKALRLAVLVGDIERAKQAAQRLFGLQLDTQMRAQLAAQMQQLGLHKMAETVLRRAQRRAGGRAADLAALMQQYQAQGANDQAVSLALQIVRRSPSSRNPRGRDANRQQALTILSSEGKLDELIAGKESQLEAAPTSRRIQMQLAELYQAAGKATEAVELYDKMAESRPDDARLRYQLAQMISQTSERDKAIPHYLAAIKLEPRVMQNDYWQVIQTFRNAKKLDQLADLFDEIDVAQLGNYWVGTQMVQYLIREEEFKSQGMKLFGKLWEAFPRQRQSLLQSVNDESLWQLPQIYDYAKEALIPGESQTVISAWHGLDRVMSFNSSGRVQSLVSRTLTAAEAQKKIDELSSAVDEANQRIPDWTGGKALAMILQAHRGEMEDAKKAAEELYAEESANMPDYARWVIAGALYDHEPMRPFIVRMLEHGLKSYVASAQHEFSYSPMRMLVDHYASAGDKSEARRVLLTISGMQSNNQHDPNYAAYSEVRNRQAIAEKFLELDLAADAARVVSDLLEDENTLALADRMSSNMSSQFRETAERAFGSLNDESLTLMLDDLLSDAADDTEADSHESQTATARRARKPGVDLMMMVRPKALDRALVTSLVELAVSAAKVKPQRVSELRAALEKLGERAENDVSLNVLAALLARAADDEPAFSDALARLEAMLSAAPLEELEAGQRANARQRQEAADRLGVWLVARAAWEDDQSREVAMRLSERALEAAGRQKDSAWLVAMHREAAGQSLKSGDTERALEQMGQMLTHAFAPRGGAAQTDDAAPTRPLTLDRFQFAIGVAKMAAENGMLDVSFDAVRRALAGGPPVKPLDTRLAQTRGAGGLVIGTATPAQGDQTDVSTFDAVRQAVTRLELSWRKANASPEDLFELLGNVLMPPGRPDEIFLYRNQFEGFGPQRPRNLGDLLCEWAVNSGRAAQLREQLKPYGEIDSSQLAAEVLLGKLALIEQDPREVRRSLKALQKRVEKDNLAYSAELASHVAVPALGFKSVARTAEDLVRASMKIIGRDREHQPFASLQFALARHLYAQGKVDEGGRLLQGLVIRAALRNRDLNLIFTCGVEMIRGGSVEQAFGLLVQQFEAGVRDQEATGGTDTILGGGNASGTRQLQMRSAKDRYDYLKTFVIPPQGNRVVFYIGGFRPSQTPPDVFFTNPADGREPVEPPSLEGGILNTAKWLIDTAREANKLDDLEKAIDEAIARGQINAKALKLYYDFTRSEGEAVADQLRERVEDRRAKWKTRGTRENQIPIFDFHLAQHAIGDPALVEAAEDLLRISRLHSSEHLFLTHQQQASGQAIIARNSAEKTAPFDDPGLIHWRAAGHENYGLHQIGSLPPWWVAHDGYIAHRLGREEDHLYFRYPLSGEFEFSIDVSKGDYITGHLGYGGIINHWWADNPGSVRLTTAGGEERRSHPKDDKRPWPNETFHRMTIRVGPEGAEYLVDGRHVYTDQNPSATTPWLSLVADRADHAVYRNLKFEGNPVIPDKVRLVEGDHLNGWVAAYYLEQKPIDRFARENFDAPGYGRVAEERRPQERPSDWWAESGIIHARAIVEHTGIDPVESRLYYNRPMFDGESVSYEFFYEPEAICAHPALDRLTFLLNPEGVRLHWMTDGVGYEWSGLSTDNVAEEPDNRRGDGSLPLKPGEWNTMRIAIDDGVVSLVLNGTPIYERPLEPNNDRLFGFFHFKDSTEVLIRNVVLQGDWPRTLSPEVMANPLEKREGELPLADRRARRQLIGEEFFNFDARAVVEEARDLPTEERHARLKSWVGPQEDRRYVRLAGYLVEERAGDAGGDSSRSVEGDAEKGPRPSTSPAELNAPVIEVLRVAGELGKLDELEETLTGLAPQTDYDRRAVLSATTLFALARGQTELAVDGAEQLRSLAEAVPYDIPVAHRWPSLIAASELLKSEATRPAGARILAVLHDQCEAQNLPTAWREMVAAFLAEQNGEASAGGD